ncbi:hypothetical protein [Roseovarius indicus]|jgi:hypothetical protein|uniref:Uncharacterized protein n=1 Tax=Roseovarius indicus TaxID=540747 RepID=A0A0T5P8T6_9RHOB|nr:hypothetical protein [Roseovarius indicus]KRS17416.1 hypothetical protein XM52_13040 [Roseovarius indicus]QEW26598.1 hypothetical protein RIdsm_02398 [Roseovarius indicus]SFD62952.1 hypothetical protein SAMN04488031_101944 [Roseovarius indicus]
MAQDTDTTPPALKAAFEATDLNVLPLDKAVLLGTFVRGDGSAALVRTASGDIRKLARGDHLGYAVVTAIETGALHLAQGGMARKLTMPPIQPGTPARVRPHARPEDKTE